MNKGPVSFYTPGLLNPLEQKMTRPSYFDSLNTVERMMHTALLDAHTAADQRLEHITRAVGDLTAAVENLLAYEQTRLFRVLRWLRLL